MEVTQASVAPGSGILTLPYSNVGVKVKLFVSVKRKVDATKATAASSFTGEMVRESIPLYAKLRRGPTPGPTAADMEKS
jgi:hypothetical protein